MPTLLTLSAPYSTILCDIWGVIHDGGNLLPGAADRLMEWKRMGKRIILITNAPRPASSVQVALDALGLPGGAYDAITSSGEAGIAALVDLQRTVGFLGSTADGADLVAHGVRLTDEDAADVVCTGLSERSDLPSGYLDQLEAWVARGVLLHCLNPDREVLRCGVREACAGALADLYEAIGGRVAWYGKPHAPIYAHALRLAGNPPKEEVLAIGDGPLTDMLGAALFGIDALFISHGIHGGAPFPSDFASRHGLGAWRPIATLPDLS